jgi:predicted NBD/HSP70 family sugar kinase
VRLVAGLDVGGTKTLGIVADADGRTVARFAAATRSGDPATLLGFVADATVALAAAAGVAVGDLLAVGVGIPGLVDPSSGSVRNAVNLGLGPAPVPLADHLASVTGVRIVVLNDVDAAAVGASTLLGRPDLAYLSIGTGVAAGFVLGGALRRGRRGASGEIGHLVIDPAGPECRCGQRGCMEAMVAGPAIARQWPASNGTSPAVALADAAQGGDPRAVAVLAVVADNVAAAVTVLALTVDPDVVVLGGGVTEAGAPLFDAVGAALRHRAAAASLLTDLDLAGRLVVLPPARAAGAVGAAVHGRAALR